MVSNITLVEVPDDDEDLNVDNEFDEDPSKRLIKYHLGPDFLQL